MTTEAVPESVQLTGTPVTRSRPRRSVSAGAWLSLRVTGLLLSVLVLGHLLFVHLLTDVSQTGPGFIARRWSSALWVVWDGTMLTACFLHGAIGATTVVRDYTRRRWSRLAWLTSLYSLCAALTGLGWFAIVTIVSQTSR